MTDKELKKKMDEVQKDDYKNDVAINKAKREITKLDSMDDFFLEKMNMSVQQLQLLQSWYPKITAGELQYCMEFQKQYRLSLFLKEVWLVPRSFKTGEKDQYGKDIYINKYEPMIGIDGVRKVFRNKMKEMNLPLKPVNVTYEINKSFRPIEIVVGGEDVIEWKEFNDMIFTASVEVGKETFVYSAPFSELCQKTNKGKLTKFWKNNGGIPIHMSCKSVEFRLLKSICGLALNSPESIDYTENAEYEEVNNKNNQNVDNIKKIVENAQPVKEIKIDELKVDEKEINNIKNFKEDIEKDIIESSGIPKEILGEKEESINIKDINKDVPQNVKDLSDEIEGKNIKPEDIKPEVKEDKKEKNISPLNVEQKLIDNGLKMKDLKDYAKNENAKFDDMLTLFIEKPGTYIQKILKYKIKIKEDNKNKEADPTSKLYRDLAKDGLYKDDVISFAKYKTVHPRVIEKNLIEMYKIYVEKIKSWKV